MTILLLSFALLTNSCAKRVGHLMQSGIIPEKQDIAFTVNAGGTHTLNVVYTGCGGMLIARKNEAVLIDPFYSDQSLLRLGLRSIRTKTQNVARVFDTINKVVNAYRDVKAVLVAHSHYDHLQDLPYVLQRDLLSPQIMILGSRSTSCTVQGFMQQEKFIDADLFLHGQGKDSAGGWLQVAKHIRIMPIRSGHAPHTKKHYWMHGNTCDDPFKWGKGSGSKTNPFDWKDGTVYSFLIDFSDDEGRTEFRVFLQSSSCTPPAGFPSKDDTPIDLAILGVASAQNVKGYPSALLRHLQPKKVLLIHWEDFFRDLYSKKPKSVRLTDVDAVLDSVRVFYGVPNLEALKDKAIMPLPLSKIRVTY